ncbi:MAG TPA: hypothetical protein VL947_01375 [Cytophagales bacterium]|nr:hypothetical protein [Cytophagales bacterium]
MNFKNLLITLSLVALMGACTQIVVVKANPKGKVPPGQMKKATGAKSAKNYAPGHQKVKHH